MRTANGTGPVHGEPPHLAPRTLWTAIGIAAALHVAAYAWVLWAGRFEPQAPEGAPGLQVTFAATPAPPAPPPEEEPAEEDIEDLPEEEPAEEEAVQELPPPPPEKPDIPLRAAEPPPKPAAPPAPAERAPGPEGQAAQPSPSPAPYAGNADARASYIAELQAWLARHKRYPRAARRRGQEGDAVLRFVVDRTGRIRRSSLDSGTGFGRLDREVMDMLARAQPLPPVPEDFGAETVEVVITVRFNLR